MMREVSVTVVIPFYKGERYIEKTIDSILSQTYRDFRIIIVNDGSPEFDEKEFENILSKDERISLLNKVNGGVACARNAGIAKATSQYIAFCDQDDLWLPEKLAKQMVLFDDPDVGLVFCGAIEDHVAENRKVELPFFDAFRGDIFSALLEKNEIVSCTAIAKKHLLEQVDAFDNERELMGVDDWLAWLKISTTCKVDFVEEYLAIHVFHEGNYSSNEIKMYRAEMVCLEKIVGFLKCNSLKYDVNIAKIEQNIHLRYAESLTYNGDFRLGGEALIKASEFSSNRTLYYKGTLLKYIPEPILGAAQYMKRLVR